MAWHVPRVLSDRRGCSRQQEVGSGLERAAPLLQARIVSRQSSVKAFSATNLCESARIGAAIQALPRQKDLKAFLFYSLCAEALHPSRPKPGLPGARALRQLAFGRAEKSFFSFLLLRKKRRDLGNYRRIILRFAIFVVFLSMKKAMASAGCGIEGLD
jgi:hypothetical protein